MAIVLNDNLQINAGKPIDSKYFNAAGVPYGSLSEVLTTIAGPLRYQGLTVNITGVEYWFANGVTNSDLVAKGTGGGGGTNGVATYVFQNGLTNTADVITLGGTLTQDVDIEGNFQFELGSNVAPMSFIDFAAGASDYSAFSDFRMQGNTIRMSLYPSGTLQARTELTSTGVHLYGGNPDGANTKTQIDVGLDSAHSLLITDSRTGSNRSGVEYAADYSTNYTSRSLVDKNYVDTKVSNGTAGWATNSSNAYHLTTNIPSNDFVFGTGTSIGAPNSTYTGNDNVLVVMTQTNPTVHDSLNYINNVFVFGEKMEIYGNPAGGGTVTDSAMVGFGHIIGDNVNWFSGSSTFTYGTFNDNFAINSFVGGEGARVLGTGGEGGVAIGIDGVPSIGGSTRDNLSNYRYVIAAGNAINISHNSINQSTSGHGALGAYSAIIGGQDHNIPTDSPRSIVLGGNAIKARAGEPDQVYVPNLNIASTPALAGTNGTQVLVRDSSNGKIEYVNLSSVGGGSSYTFANGLTESSGTVSLGGTITSPTFIDGHQLLGIGLSTELSAFGVNADSFSLYSNTQNAGYTVDSNGAVLTGVHKIKNIVTSMSTNSVLQLSNLMSSGSAASSGPYYGVGIDFNLSSQFNTEITAGVIDCRYLTPVLGGYGEFIFKMDEGGTLNQMARLGPNYFYLGSTADSGEVQLSAEGGTVGSKYLTLTGQNLKMFGSSTDFGSAVGATFVSDAVTLPSTAVSGNGGLMYSDGSDSHKLKYKVGSTVYDLTSGGLTYTASNGLTMVGSTDVQLGGTLTGDIALDGSVNFSLGYTTNLNTIGLYAADAITIQSLSTGAVHLQGGGGSYIDTGSSSYGMTINNVIANLQIQGLGGSLFIGSDTASSIYFNDTRTGTNQSGIEYGSDYSANYTDRSLVDKAFVISQASAVTGITTSSAPSTSSSTGTIGEIRFDSGYLYICTATNTWKRVALSTF
ncbi:MAG: hypothetical protein JSS79_05230 [Bacteroidetes bacterium]|nr:hypothetical protein [Bacteroidota bacterium]